VLKILKINVIPSHLTVFLVSLNYISVVVIDALRVFCVDRGLKFHAVRATAVVGRYIFFFSVSQQCVSWIPELR